MARKKMRSALSASLKAEGAAVKSRFEKAEALLSDHTDTIGKKEEATQKSSKPTQPKVVRDSFTLPTEDHQLISTIKQRCLDSAVNVTKSEVIRAGLHALNNLQTEELLHIFEELPKVKTGRPAKN